MVPVIEVNGLTKKFKDVTAVNDLSFTVQKGEVYGFLGQNGAGKSTTIRMLLTLIRPTSGQIRMFGKELSSNKIDILRKTGAVIEKPDLYKYLTGLENLSMFARLSGLKLSTHDLVKQLDRVGLAERANSKVKTYSQGMKQRLGIAVALAHDPDLIILDEPVNGLDPQGIADIRHLIQHLSHDLKKTIFVSSHLLSEVELISDKLLIIDRGKKIAEGKIDELLDPSKMILELETGDNTSGAKVISELSFASNVSIEKNKLLIRLHQDHINELIKGLVSNGINILSVRSKHSLEDYFLSLTSGNHNVELAAN